MTGLLLCPDIIQSLALDLVSLVYLSCRPCTRSALLVPGLALHTSSVVRVRGALTLKLFALSGGCADDSCARTGCSTSTPQSQRSQGFHRRPTSTGPLSSQHSSLRARRQFQGCPTRATRLASSRSAQAPTRNAVGRRPSPWETCGTRTRGANRSFVRISGSSGSRYEARTGDTQNGTHGVAMC